MVFDISDGTPHVKYHSCCLCLKSISEDVKYEIIVLK